MTSNHKPVTDFKNFDFKDYDVKSMKKADSLLKRAWDKLKRATSTQDFKLVAGLLLTVAVLISKNPKIISILKDIVNGRFDFSTLEDLRDVLTDVFNKLKTQKETTDNDNL